MHEMSFRVDLFAKWGTVNEMIVTFQNNTGCCEILWRT